MRLLRCDSASGYRNVYRHHNHDAFGRQMYVARVKRNGRLVTLKGSRSALPHVCARHVAAWYKDTFGPAWRGVLANRKNRARPAEPPWRVYRSAADGGFTLTVFLDGEEELAVRWDAARRRWTDRPIVFATREAAEAFARCYARYRYALAGSCLRLGRKTVWGGLSRPPQPFHTTPGLSLAGPAGPSHALPRLAPKGLKLPKRRRKSNPDPEPPPPFAPALSRAA